MSLLGRLEDLSLTDIVQIVYLSRRTGVLEIINDAGRHTVLFRSGLVVNAASPENPDLISYLHAAQLIRREHVEVLRQMEDSGIPPGTVVLEMNLLSAEDIGDAIRDRILSVVTPLLNSKEGEFNFILSETMSAIDAEYEAEKVFKEGGLAPTRLLGGTEGEKLKPLRGLEESLKAGKALLRGAASSEPPPVPLSIALGHVAAAAPAASASEPFSDSDQPDSDKTGDGNVVRFPAPPASGVAMEIPESFTPLDELPFPEDEIAGGEDDAAPARRSATPVPTVALPARTSMPAGQFKVAGGLFEVESPEVAFRNVVLFERNPLVRVAARRAFTRHNIRISQFGSLDDVRSTITELFRSNSYFVTFLELTNDDASVRLMQQLKRKNPRLPVVVVDSETDLRRRHDLLRAGADLYVTKPAPARMQPGLVEEELALFADELVLFAERSFDQWLQMTGGGVEAGKKFYELASKETIDRSFGLLRQLINELSNPNDIGQVAATILRLSAEYLDRGALFMLADDSLVGLGGFGPTGGGDAMDERIRSMRLGRSEPSVFSDVLSQGTSHRGKMRRTQVNVSLIEKMGGMLPTEVVALPIMHGDRTVGILYGDNAEHRGPIDSMTGLEIFLSQAGYAFGNAVFASERAGRGL